MLKKTPTWQECFDAGMNAVEAAEMRGRSTNAARHWADRHGLRWPPAPPGGGYGNAMPCRIHGKLYRSQKEAAAALGVHPTTISHAIARGDLDDVGTSNWREGNVNGSRSITLFGRTFTNRAGCAAFLGISRPALYRRLRAGRVDDLLALFKRAVAAEMAQKDAELADKMRQSAMASQQALKAAEMVDRRPTQAQIEGARKAGALNKGRKRK